MHECFAVEALPTKAVIAFDQSVSFVVLLRTTVHKNKGDSHNRLVK